VSVTEARLAAQLGGGPVLFAESPVTGPPASGGRGSTAELLVVMPRLVRGVAFTVDYGDGTTAQPLQPTTHTVTVRCRLVHSSVCVCKGRFTARELDRTGLLQVDPVRRRVTTRSLVTRVSFTTGRLVIAVELSMGWVDPWVGLGRDFSVFGGLGWVYSKSI